MHRLLVLALTFALTIAPPATPATAAQGRLFGEVVSVDNAGALRVQIASGPIVTVRLIGVEAPDLRAPAQPSQCFEAEASTRAAELLPVGAAVGLERDIQDSDQYGRIPAYVWPVAGGSMVNEQLIAEGFVQHRAESMNVRHAARFAQAQQAAQVHHLGVWTACVAGAQTTTDAQGAPCTSGQP